MEESQPVSPTGEYLSTSVLSLSIIAVLESEVPLDDLDTRSLLRDVFLPINPRFSSIMVTNAKGVKKWRKVQVNLEDHIKVPKFPTNKPLEFYDKCLDKYLSNLGISAAGNIILRLHHALGDGVSLMGALLSCLQRADDPSIPLTFPSSHGTNYKNNVKGGCVATKFMSVAVNTVSELCPIVMKGGLVEDSKSAVRSGHAGVEFLDTSIVTIAFSMDDVKQIKMKLGVTINDVICGAIFLGVRIYMERVNPGSGGYTSVTEMVKPGAEYPWGNHFAFLGVPVPKLSNHPRFDPLEFVLKTHETIKKKRTSLSVYFTAKYLQLLRTLRGPEAVSKYLYDTMKNSSFGITNVIGPVERMALANHPIKGLYFAVPGAPQSMGVAVMSYVDQLRVAIRVEKDFVDSQNLKSCVEESFAKIFESACGRK
ncbi:Wax ester synthase/diacylglycerol acyltransferase 4 [Linum perenne]